MKNKWKLILLGILILAIGTISLFIVINNKGENLEVIDDIQQKYFTPMQQFASHSLNKTVPKNNEIDTIIALVNGWPITSGEIAYRKWMREIYDEASDDNFIFNLLVEEKIELSQALKYNVLPTAQDVSLRVDNLKNEVMNGTETGKILMSLNDERLKYDEDYLWQVVMPYNEFRSQSFINSSNAIYDANWNSNLEENDKTLYWKEFMELKQKAKVKIKENKTLYSYVSDRIFTYGNSPVEGRNLEEIIEKLQ